MARPECGSVVEASTPQIVEERVAGLAVVAIGRNEGERLKACLGSAVPVAAVTVYVDSGSTDDSIEIARLCGAEIVSLDPATAFSAARARNAGYRRALEVQPEVCWVQFVDGDCEVQPGWLTEASHFLEEHPDSAAVCGRRRERHPEQSIYNELCDIEWDIPPGKTKYFGGDVMIRVEALVAANGYREELIAGEEPELCVRLRRSGWQIYVLDREMTLHDANMHRFSQWWRRTMRSGWAYAAGAHIHGRGPERHWVWRTAQAWIWVAGPILTALVLTPFIGVWVLCLVGIYPLQIGRMFTKLPGIPRRRWLTAVATTLGRFPEFVGQIRYLRDLYLTRTARLIEYK